MASPCMPPETQPQPAGPLLGVVQRMRSDGARGRGRRGAELVARSRLLCSGEMKGKLPPKASEEEGSKWGSEGSPGMLISENLPRCHGINSSW